MLNAIWTAVCVVVILTIKEAIRSRLIAWRSQPLSEGIIVAAVHRACIQVGLPAEQLTSQFDLVQTGKLYEVLHYAAATLSKDHELRTVGDVIDWLAVAPQTTSTVSRDSV